MSGIIAVSYTHLDVYKRQVGGDLIGFSVVMTVIDEAHLLNIGVCQRYQGQGYGARLLRHAMENARLNHASKLFLEVRPSNERAVELYRHFGFRQIGLRKGCLLYTSRCV